MNFQRKINWDAFKKYKIPHDDAFDTTKISFNDMIYEKELKDAEVYLKKLGAENETILW